MERSSHPRNGQRVGVGVYIYERSKSLNQLILLDIPAGLFQLEPSRSMGQKISARNASRLRYMPLTG